MRNQSFLRILQKAAFILIVAVVCGFLQNHEMMLHSDRYFQEKEAEKLQKEDVITLEEAKEAFESGEYIFLDARSEEEYLPGHIAGALLVPAVSFDDYFPLVQNRLTGSSKIIVYCSDIHCDLAEKLKERLKNHGFEHVRLFAEGWLEWAAFGFPSE